MFIIKATASYLKTNVLTGNRKTDSVMHKSGILNNIHSRSVILYFTRGHHLIWSYFQSTYTSVLKCNGQKNKYLWIYLWSSEGIFLKMWNMCQFKSKASSKTHSRVLFQLDCVGMSTFSYRVLIECFVCYVVEILPHVIYISTIASLYIFNVCSTYLNHRTNRTHTGRGYDFFSSTAHPVFIFFHINPSVTDYVQVKIQLQNPHNENISGMCDSGWTILWSFTKQIKPNQINIWSVFSSVFCTLQVEGLCVSVVRRNRVLNQIIWNIKFNKHTHMLTVDYRNSRNHSYRSFT